jgi:hypothetical protein
MTADSAWSAYLDHLEAGLDRVERSLLTRDLDRATSALAALDDAGRRDELPVLPSALAERAVQLGDRMLSAEGLVLGILARLRPELALLSGMTAGDERPSLFVDEPA